MNSFKEALVFVVSVPGHRTEEEWKLFLPGRLNWTPARATAMLCESRCSLDREDRAGCLQQTTYVIYIEKIWRKPISLCVLGSAQKSAMLWIVGNYKCTVSSVQTHAGWILDPVTRNIKQHVNNSCIYNKWHLIQQVVCVFFFLNSLVFSHLRLWIQKWVIHS